MSRNVIAAGVAFVAAALLAAGGLTAEETKKATKEQLKEMMTKAHSGAKSPLARTAVELKKDKPDWDQLAKDAKEFVAMGDVLKVSVDYTDPKRYIAAAGSLTNATEKKDAKAATEALTNLNKSCSACHYGVPK